MLVVRCKGCNTELIGSSKLQVCNCPNKMQVKDNKISAVDLSQVIMVNSMKEQKSNVLSSQDIAWQEARRQRKVKRLDFEVR